MSRALNQFGDSGLPRRGNETKLREHPKSVKHTPVCDYLAVIVKAKDVDAIDFELLPGWRHTHEMTFVCSCG
jgi:hypothetical protein